MLRQAVCERDLLAQQACCVVQQMHELELERLDLHVKNAGLQRHHMDHFSSSGKNKLNLYDCMFYFRPKASMQKICRRSLRSDRQRGKR